MSANRPVSVSKIVLVVSEKKWSNLDMKNVQECIDQAVQKLHNIHGRNATRADAPMEQTPVPLDPLHLGRDPRINHLEHIRLPQACGVQHIGPVITIRSVFSATFICCRLGYFEIHHRNRRRFRTRSWESSLASYRSWIELGHHDRASEALPLFLTSCNQVAIRVRYVLERFCLRPPRRTRVRLGGLVLFPYKHDNT